MCPYSEKFLTNKEGEDDLCNNCNLNYFRPFLKLYRQWIEVCFDYLVAIVKIIVKF